MGEVQVQIPQQQQQQQPTELLQLRESVEPIDLSMLHLNAANSAAAAGGCYHHHHPNPPCTVACNGSCNGSFVSNSMKRRSPATSSGDGAGQRSAKKLFCDQDDLALRGFSAVSLPMSLGAVAGGRPCCPVLRRCVSDPYTSPAAMAVAEELPEGVASGGGNPGTPPPARGSGLPPLPPSLRRTVSDVTPSPVKVLSRSSSSEETTPDSSVRLRRMKDRLREMKQWCDEALKDEEEEQEEEKEKDEEELAEGAVAEDDKVPPLDELGGDSEEAVSVEWAEKCLSLTFRCPCGKGYEVLLSANNCYYKLV